MMTTPTRRSRTSARGVLLLASAIALACGPASGSTDVSQSDALRWIQENNGPLIIDVRTPGEFGAGHVPGAVNIPHDVLGQHLDEISDQRNQKVVVYCERGPRAAKASAVLVGAGFSDVRHLEGDMAGWRDANLPVEK